MNGNIPVAKEITVPIYNPEVVYLSQPPTEYRPPAYNPQVIYVNTVPTQTTNVRSRRPSDDNDNCFITCMSCICCCFILETCL
jgi:hypothetical protein